MSTQKHGLTVEAFAASLPEYGPLLGIDPGTKTLGLAISDTRRSLATPLETIQRSKYTADVMRLKALVAEHGIVGLVIGMPTEMTGAAGPRAQSVRALARSLEADLALPILSWDERLSTVAVERTMVAVDMSRARRAEMVDRAAAAFILDGALARLQYLEAQKDDR